MNINRQFPIGKFSAHEHISVDESIQEMEKYPSQLIQAVSELTEDELKNPYRVGGWTGIQVINHIADAQMNGYIRIKLALTEDNPVIKPYEQDQWALLPDNDKVSYTVSLKLIEALYKRWCACLKELSETDLNKTYFHPEHQASHTVASGIKEYNWHGKHHLGHIRLLKSI